VLLAVRAKKKCILARFESNNKEDNKGDDLVSRRAITLIVLS
jgi:hypothetical protein